MTNFLNSGITAVKTFVKDRLAGGWTRRQRFTQTFRNNYWRGRESRSGPGSDLDSTVTIRSALADLVRDLHVTSILDVPCGDFHWMSHVELRDVTYTGADIVPDIIAANRARHARAGRDFVLLDAVAKVPPRADLVLCRDLLVHLSFRDALRVLANVRASGSTWLLTTTFTERRANTDLADDWRPINLERAPFRLPPPTRLIVEDCTSDDGQYRDKALALWPVSILQ